MKQSPLTTYLLSHRCSIHLTTGTDRCLWTSNYQRYRRDQRLFLIESPSNYILHFNKQFICKKSVKFHMYVPSRLRAEQWWFFQRSSRKMHRNVGIGNNGFKFRKLNVTTSIHSYQSLKIVRVFDHQITRTENKRQIWSTTLVVGNMYW